MFPPAPQYLKSGLNGQLVSGHCDIVAPLHVTSHLHELLHETNEHARGPSQSVLHGPSPQLIDPQARAPEQVISQLFASRQTTS
jgi:hypothetical protein